MARRQRLRRRIGRLVAEAEVAAHKIRKLEALLREALTTVRSQDVRLAAAAEIIERYGRALTLDIYYRHEADLWALTTTIDRRTIRDSASPDELVELIAQEAARTIAEAVHPGFHPNRYPSRIDLSAWRKGP